MIRLDKYDDDTLARVAMDGGNRYMLAAEDVEGLRKYITGAYMPGSVCDAAVLRHGRYLHKSEHKEHDCGTYTKITPVAWPFTNLALACIASTQDELDARWPVLATIPAARRGLVLRPTEWMDLDGFTPEFVVVEPPPTQWPRAMYDDPCVPIDPPVNVAHIRTIVEQCHEAGVPCDVADVADVWPNLYSPMGFIVPVVDVETGKSVLPDDLRIHNELWEAGR